jgi:hypothetical protein
MQVLVEIQTFTQKDVNHSTDESRPHHDNQGTWNMLLFKANRFYNI